MSLDSVKKTTGAYLAFVSDVPVRDRTKVLEGCPPPIHGYVAWGDRLLSVETAGDALEWELRDAYGNARDKAGPFAGPTTAMLEAFGKATDAWILGVHARHPLLFAIGPGDTLEDAWATESNGQLTALLVDFLTDYVARNALSPAEDDGLTSEISGMHVACMLQYVPPRVPRALQPKVTALRKRFRL